MAARVVVPPRAIFVVIALIGLVAVIGLAYVYLPRATIAVSAATEERRVEQEILLSTAATEPDFKDFVLPARLIDKAIEEELSVQREGQGVQEDFARGTVTLINTLNEEQPLRTQTHLRHADTGVYFLLDQAVRLPVQGSLEVNVTAEEVGAAGNVPAGRFIIDRLPAELQDAIYAESSSAFTGGEVFDTPLTEDELVRAQDTILEEARRRAQAELTGETGGAPLREDLTTVEIEEQQATADVGSRATSYTVRARIRARAFVVDENDLLSLTLLALRSQLPADEEFISFNPDSFGAEILRADFEQGEARIRGTLTGNVARKAGPAVFAAENLAGRSEAEVAEYFQQFDSVSSVDVRLSPFWVQTVPSRPEATEIVFQ